MLKALTEHWFLTEPALFALYCQQQVEENVRMECAVRCGQGRLEYNPLMLQHKTFAETEQLIRIELIRLFLKHPYEREPEGCCREAMSIGSDITIADGYCTLHKEKLPLQEPGLYHLPMGQYYEWYAKKIQEQMADKEHKPRQSQYTDQQPGASYRPESPDTNQRQGSQPNPADQPNTNEPPQPSDKSREDQSALWREDSLQRQRINDLIERTTDWGTLPAEVVEKIKASTQARINNRLIWQGFKSTILNSQRRLTRMRPNRRTGFVQMGNTRQFLTRLLVAIDVSGSISTQHLADFYSAINRLFLYGIAQIDTVQFDADLGPVEPMQQASRLISVTGRGGTNFQPIIDYFCLHKEYDGLVILTDGQAPPPVISHIHHPPILWVCQNQSTYNSCHSWMQQSGRCCHL